jgi:ABC-type lipoprotein export system ATPase subunit
VSWFTPLQGTTPTQAEQPHNGRLPVAPTATAPVVELIGLGRAFSSDPPVIALHDVNLTLERGTSLSIVGPSGSGKSTLLNVLGCLDRQTTGTYLIDGIDVGKLGDDERAALRAERIGFVFQSFHLLAHRSVVDNVMLGEVYRGTPVEGREARARAALERVGLTDRATFLPTKLSGGQQQRVAIARALVSNPSLLLCDEPTGNLDSANTRSLLALFDELGSAGLTLVIVTHDDEVAAHAQRRARMVDGHLTEETS